MLIFWSTIDISRSNMVHMQATANKVTNFRIFWCPSQWTDFIIQTELSILSKKNEKFTSIRHMDVFYKQKHHTKSDDSSSANDIKFQILKQWNLKA